MHHEYLENYAIRRRFQLRHSRWYSVKNGLIVWKQARVQSVRISKRFFHEKIITFFGSTNCAYAIDKQLKSNPLFRRDGLVLFGQNGKEEKKMNSRKWTTPGGRIIESARMRCHHSKGFHFQAALSNNSSVIADRNVHDMITFALMALIWKKHPFGTITKKKRKRSKPKSETDSFQQKSKTASASSLPCPIDKTSCPLDWAQPSVTEIMICSFCD